MNANVQPVPNHNDLSSCSRESYRLWIGGRWRVASMADALTSRIRPPNAGSPRRQCDGRDCIAAVDAAQVAFATWSTKTPRERGEILRRAFELVMRDADRLARIITLETARALPTRALDHLPAEFFRWNAGRRFESSARFSRAPSSGARFWWPISPPESHAGHAVEFPARHGDSQDRSGAGRRLHGGHKPATATPLTMLALMPLLQEAGVRRVS